MLQPRPAADERFARLPQRPGHHCGRELTQQGAPGHWRAVSTMEKTTRARSSGRHGHVRKEPPPHLAVRAHDVEEQGGTSSATQARGPSSGATTLVCNLGDALGGASAHAPPSEAQRLRSNAQGHRPVHPGRQARRLPLRHLLLRPAVAPRSSWASSAATSPKSTRATPSSL